MVLPNWAWLLIGGLVGGILGAVLASSVNSYEPIAGNSYGDDAFLDKAYDLCQAGELSSCDLLWSYSEQGSEYESLAETCGGRRERNAEVFCIEDERVVGDAATDAGG